ncbi:MAG: ABC transporter permease [Deltaproteobacteria bacterium]|nr:ABC transporter permease [Deltaproteobacteria bacterium]
MQAIAVNTFREAVRDKVLYSLLFFAIALIGASVVLNRLAIGQQTKIITDLGLASISIFGTLIAAFVGIGLVSKEIERRTIFTIVSKPVSRGCFILGKYLGLVLTLAVEVAIMSACFLTMLAIYADDLVIPALWAIGLIFMELSVVTAVAIFFSSFSTAFLSGLFTMAVWLIGHFTPDLRVFGERSGTAMRWLTEFLYYALPNLRNFNIKEQVVHGIPVAAEFMALSVVYGLVYVSVLLVVATLVFERRDFV